MTTDGHSLITGRGLPLVPPELLAHIVSTAADIAFVVEPSGLVLSVLVNPHHRSFGQLGHWEGQQIRSVLTPESVVKFDDRMRELMTTEATLRAVELNHSDENVWEFPIRYALHRIDADGTLLMLGRDLRPIAEMQQQLVKAQLALERDYEAVREIDTRYRVLMESTRDAIVIVSMTTGRITDLNLAAAMILGASRQDLIGSAIAQEFEGRRRGEFLESMANLAVADKLAPLDLQSRRSHKRVLVVPTMFRAAGERLLLCRLDAAEDADVVPDELSEGLASLYTGGVEGIVFTDVDGIVRAANEAFLNLADAANITTVKGRSFGDFLARGAIDLKVLLDNARRNGHMRMYATKIATAHQGQVSVEISATYVTDRPNPFYAFVLRNASRAESLRRNGAGPAGDDGMRNVAELVGASSLKDIVAETTDVIERMCIETAVELTRNNRVAAAEMLGLSRQSLYVKLRKFGLLAREED